MSKKARASQCPSYHTRKLSGQLNVQLTTGAVAPTATPQRAPRSHAAHGAQRSLALGPYGGLLPWRREHNATAHPKTEHASPTDAFGNYQAGRQASGTICHRA